jgi:hypothetical protein
LNALYSPLSVDPAFFFSGPEGAMPVKEHFLASLGLDLASSPCHGFLLLVFC